MYSRKWLFLALLACGFASACSQYNTNLSIQTASSVLTFLSPSAAPVGSSGFTITANGGGFTAGALILWNGTPLNTTVVNSIQLTAPVPASLLATPGTVKVAVQIPGSAQSATSNVSNTTTTEISNIVLFTIDAVPGTPPAITSVSESTTGAASTAYCGAQGFTLAVAGTNFTSDALVNWNGGALPTTFVSATQLTATVSAAQAAFPGAVSVSVTNSIGASGSLPFTLTTPTAALAVPAIASLSQTSAAAGSPALTLTVTGSSILPCSVVQWTNATSVTTTLTTTYVSATQLTATVPAADFLSAGTAQVGVMTLSPGGGASATSIPFTIAAPSITSVSAATTSSNSTPSCSAANVTITVTGANFVNGSAVQWVTSPPPAIPATLATTFVSSTQLSAIVPAAFIASAGTVNIQVSNAGVVSNATPFGISSASSLPQPGILTITPASATAGAAGVTLTVTGTNILPCSVVQWTNGGTTTLATTYVNATQTAAAQLVAVVPAADIASVGTAQIAIASPASSANTSSAVAFQIGLPIITSLSASTTGLNNTPYCSQAGLTLTVNGTGFAQGLTVYWNGSPRPTTFVSPTQLVADITPADTAYLATGAAAVAITVSGGPGTNSGSMQFSLTALPGGATLPQPAIVSISPSSAAVEPATGPPVALAVNGSSLSPCSVVQWNGDPLPASIFIGTSGLSSFIPAPNLTTAGSDQVSVATPGAGASSNAGFTVYTPGTPGSGLVAGAPLSLPLMSSNQRYAVYVLASTDGSTETPGATQNVFLRDTCAGVPSGCTVSTTLVSAGFGGATSNGDSVAPAISSNSTGFAADAGADGRYVTFLSSATNLVSGGTASGVNAFIRDTCAGVASGCTPSTQLVSQSTGGTGANAPTTSATIDASGRYVTFVSSATNLGSSSAAGLFLRDTCNGAVGCTPSTQPLD